MAVYTFSTKTKKPLDTDLVDRIKKLCDDEGWNFSALIIDILREWETRENVKRTS